MVLDPAKIVTNLLDFRPRRRLCACGTRYAYGTRCRCEGAPTLQIW